MKKIALIGAGVSGLAALKALKEEGLDAVAFETRARLGGLWNLDDHPTPAYDGLAMNTSRQVSGFSDFPYPPASTFYPQRADVLNYLNSYAETFHLAAHIRFNSVVTSAHSIENTRWLLAIEVNGASTTETFDGLVVCTGRHLYPHFPKFQHQERFQGDIIHSMNYKNAAPFQGKRLLLIGSGASAADIAVQLCGSADRIYMSVKDGRWIIPHFLRGRPIDHKLTRFSQRLPKAIRAGLLYKALNSELRRMRIYGGGASIGLPVPPFDLKKIRLTLNSNFLQRMRQGDILAKPTIKQFHKNKIEFNDDTVENIDTVIACTGYSVQFPFLDFDVVSSSHDFNLHHYVFHPDYKNLAFIGLVNVQGPFGPVYEMQARWTARVLSGALTLPDESTMRADISNRHAYLAAHHKRPAIVQYFDYMEQIGRILNVTPKLIKHPRLFTHLLFKPINGMQYRLNGPHAWNGAAEALKAL